MSDYGLRIVAPDRNPYRDRVRRKHDTAQLVRDVETRAKAVLTELGAKIGGCHYCMSGLYEPLPPGEECLCSKTARNGVATVAGRSTYPDRYECRGLEIRDFTQGYGIITGMR